MKTRIATAIVLNILVFVEDLHALQMYSLVDQRKTQAIISKEQHTRIAVEDGRIQQIFGAEGIFDIQTDDDQGQIFLKPNDKTISKPISITIITENGLTQDLKLIPQNLEAQSILFRTLPPQTESKVSQKSFKTTLADLMWQMMQHQSIEGYDKQVLRKADRKLDKSISLSPTLIYKGDKFEGRVYKVSNKGEYPLTLSKDRLFRPGDLAITASKESLSPKETTFVYIISNRGDFS